MNSSIKPANPSRLKALKTVVKLDKSWEDVAFELSRHVPGRDYSHSHIQKVMTGYARPSYLLAEAIIKVANRNLRFAHTKAGKQQLAEKKIRVGAKKPFDLRHLPVAYKAGENTPQYFEATPKATFFSRYSTGSIGKSLAWVADQLGVSERTLQRYVRGIESGNYVHSISWGSKPAPFKLEKKTATNEEVLNYIFAASCNAELDKLGI